jgi:hypothetical protein
VSTTSSLGSDCIASHRGMAWHTSKCRPIKQRDRATAPNRRVATMQHGVSLQHVVLCCNVLHAPASADQIAGRLHRIRASFRSRATRRAHLPRPTVQAQRSAARWFLQFVQTAPATAAAWRGLWAKGESCSQSTPTGPSCAAAPDPSGPQRATGNVPFECPPVGATVGYYCSTYSLSQLLEWDRP